jgi:hypothetical protein
MRNNQPTEKTMSKIAPSLLISGKSSKKETTLRDEFEALEREITRVTDTLLRLSAHNEELSTKCRISDDNFYLYHNGKVNAYDLAVDQLDTLRIIAKNLKDSAKE